ncbi:MAG TPA: ABC transporter substrate-binding protein [Anaerolinea sp.]|nr:ABC transporter substrate-binding protein [Anaerolinea sp.]
MDRKLKRRDFMKLSSVAFLGAVAVACAPQPTPLPTQEPPAAEPTKAPAAEPTKAPVAEATKAPEVPASVEPPFLADKVASGALPPKDQRLPESPMVVADREAIGAYGGELRINSFDPVWWVSYYDQIVERMLVYAEDGKTIVPNVLESWEVTPDGKAWTMRLRKGMKWSDGEPITTEDVHFWWFDHQANTEINSSPWWQFRFGGKNMEVEILDDYTFRFTHAVPFGNFAAQMTRWSGNDGFLWPAHYLKQFHATYTDKAKLEEMAKAAKLETWVQLYNNKIVAGVWGGPDGIFEYPKFMPHIPVSKPKEGLYMWERNPYYWKVDAEGNQLPYIDTVRLEYSANTEVTKLKIAQSELDIVGQHEVTMMEYPFYKDNESKANYVVGDYISSMGDRVTVFPNHTPYNEDGTPDDGLAKIVQDYRFVQALSMAIDREEINQVIFFGTARMGSMCPMPASKYYKEEYGQAWANYDTDAANKLLDEMGLKKGADGMRTRPDGSKLTYNLEHSGIRVGPAVPKMCEMIVAYWREVGIDATSKEIQDSLLVERKRNGQVQVTVWHADRCTDMLLHIEPQWFIPTSDGGQAGPSPKWGQWYLAADKTVEGLVEPPEDIKTMLNTFDQMTAVVDENERVKLGQQIFDYLKDNPLEIGLVLECPAPLLFNKNLRNLPKAKAYIGWDSYGLSTYHPEAFFYEGGVRA